MLVQSLIKNGIHCKDAPIGLRALSFRISLEETSSSMCVTGFYHAPIFIDGASLKS